MKKYNLLKVLAITILSVWLLSIIIPGSYMDYSGNITTDSIAGSGIFGLFSNVSTSISYFNGIAIYLIAIACFYGILNKLDVYKRFVKKTSDVFKDKERLLVIVTIIVFGIISALISDFMLMLVFVPFIYNVMKELNIDKKVFLSSTLIAALIGSMNRIYDSNLFNALSLEINTLLLVRVIVFVLAILALIFFVAPKKNKTDNKKNKKNETKNETKKSNKDVVGKKVNKTIYAIVTLLLGTIGINKFYVGKIKEGILRLLFCWTGIPTVLSIVEFVTILTEKSDKDGKIDSNSKKIENVMFGTLTVIFAIFVVVCSVPFTGYFKDFTLFTDLNNTLSEFNIAGYNVFSHLIGSPVVEGTSGTAGVINAIGSWTMTDMSILLVVLAMIIGLLSKVKFNEFISTITDSVKKILPIAITAMLVSLVLVISVTTGINITIVNAILSITKGFNIATASIATVIGSLLTGDFYYFVSTVGQVFVKAADKKYYGIVGFIVQSLYSLSMFIIPTSTGLIIGLYYLDIPFNKWFKYIWKVLLTVFIIIIFTSVILYVIL